MFKSPAKKPKNDYSAANTSISDAPWRRKGAVLEELSGGSYVLFGGKAKDPRANNGHAAYVGDTWLLETSANGAAWRPLAGSEMDGAATPVARWKTGGGAVDDAFYLFGGGSYAGWKNVFFDDLWRLTLYPQTSWTRLAPVEGQPWPQARRGLWAAATATSLVVVGGRKESHVCFRDAWVYTPATHAWYESRNIPPEDEYPCRWGHTATRIPATPGVFADEHVAVFGGRFLPTRKGVDFVYLNDLWFFDPAADKWARAPTNGTKPPARDHHAAAYVSGGLYISGGKLTDQAHRALRDLWRYDIVGGFWTELHPVGEAEPNSLRAKAAAPSSRYMHNLVGWPRAPEGGAVVLFGGEHIKSRHKGKKRYVRENDVWAFSPAEGVWTELLSGAGRAHQLTVVERHRGLLYAAVAVTTAAVLLAVGLLHRRFAAQDDGPPGVPGYV